MFKEKVSPISGSQCLLDKKNPPKSSKVQTSTNLPKTAFRYYIYDILSSFTSCDKRDFNIIITLTLSIFNFTNFVKYLNGLLIEDVLCHFPTLCNRSDAEHNFLLFYVSLDRRKLWSFETKHIFGKCFKKLDSSCSFFGQYHCPWKKISVENKCNLLDKYL